MNRTTRMKGICILTAGLITAPALAADVGIGVNLNIGNTPVYFPAPVYVPAPVVVSAPPMFIAPPSLGVSIAVGVPYDLFMISGTYYVYRGNQWYCGFRYGGPWRTVAYRRLPYQLRRHDIEHYRHVRDREYQAYNRDREGYRGRYYQAGHEGGARHQHSGRNGEHVAWNDGKVNGKVEGRGHGEGHGRSEGHGGRD